MGHGGKSLFIKKLDCISSQSINIIKKLTNTILNLYFVEKVKDNNEQEFEVAKVDFHQDYNLELPLANDLALIRIKSKANGRGIIFSDRVIPACLPPENAVYSKDMSCMVAGWGSTAHGQKGEMSFARHLQTARIPYIETEQCIQDHIYGPRKGITIAKKIQLSAEK